MSITSNAIVSNVYRYVIDDVISQVRGDFEDMGIDDSVLQELQRSWESKVARSRVANFGFTNDNYYDEEGNDNGEASQANTNNDVVNATNSYNDYQQQQQQQQTPQQAPQQQLPQPYAQYAQNYATNTNANTNMPQAASLANLALNRQQPPMPQQQQQYVFPPPLSQQQQQSYQQGMMQPPRPVVTQTLQQHPQPQLNLQLPGLQQQQQQQQQRTSNSNNIPQNDGANDVDDYKQMTTAQIDKHIEDIIQQSSSSSSTTATAATDEDEITFTAFSSGTSVSLDSLPDSVKQLMKDAREKALRVGALKKREMKRIPQLDGEGGENAREVQQDQADDNKPIIKKDGEENTNNANNTTASNTNKDDEYDLGSDLDDTDEDDDDAEGNEEIEHIILCLYDKVTRTKNKWKCVLKDGIMLVNGRDYLFHRANGDFEW